MDRHRFDDFVRAFGVARSRRQIVRALAAGATGMAGAAGVRRVAADGGEPVTGGGRAGCLDAYQACSSDGECCNGFCVDGACGGCAVNTDCPGADVCDGGVCVAALCDGNAGCGPNQVCCGGACYMGECCDDTDCAGASACVDDGSGVTVCIVTTCDTETDCAVDALCCGGVCQADFCCTGDDDCDAGSLCCDGACLPCSDGGVCGTSGGSPVCACPGGQMECATGCAECCDDDDCGSDEVCFQGECEVSCTVDADCTGDNRTCTGGACVCESGYMECGATCAECCTYLDCPGSDVCEDGVCVPLCLEGGEACDVDADCCSGDCSGGECVEVVNVLPSTGAGPGH